MLERVQKFISSAGVASRRKAEEFIKSGQVLINGKKAKLGDKVDPQKDAVKVYGRVIRPGEQKIYLMLNKPKSCVVSKKDPRRRKTVFDLLPADLKNKVWNIGRLDYDTEGLLIFTNDGDLTQKLAHPSFERDKEYEVISDVMPTESQLEKLREGVEIASGLTYPARLSLLSPRGRGQGEGAKVRITLHEGKKRQIRRMFDAVGLGIVSLKRIRIGKLMLPKDLPVGQFRLVQKSDIL